MWKVSVCSSSSKRKCCNVNGIVNHPVINYWYLFLQLCLWASFDTFIISSYTFNIPNLCILHSWRCSQGWPKQVGIYCTYKIILIYLRSSVVTVTIHIRTVDGSYKICKRSNSLHILRRQAESKAKYEINTMCQMQPCYIALWWVQKKKLHITI